MFYQIKLINGFYFLDEYALMNGDCLEVYVFNGATCQMELRSTTFIIVDGAAVFDELLGYDVVGCFARFVI